MASVRSRLRGTGWFDDRDQLFDILASQTDAASDAISLQASVRDHPVDVRATALQHPRSLTRLPPELLFHLSRSPHETRSPDWPGRHDGDAGGRLQRVRGDPDSGASEAGIELFPGKLLIDDQEGCRFVVLRK